MTSSDDHNSGLPSRRSGFKINLKPYLTGLLPLFTLAHFSHHGVGAMVRPLMPAIRADLGLNLTQAGIIQSAFTLTNGLSQLPAGWLADKVGARFMVLLGVTGVSIAGFFLGFADSMTWLIVFLILSALLGGGYHPASAAAISQTVDPEYRGRSLGIHLIGGTSAFWLVPLLVAPLVKIADWRLPFKTIPFPFIILGVVLFILIGKRVRMMEEERRKAGPVEPAEKLPVPWGKIVPFIVISVLTGTVIMSTASFLSFYAVDVLGVLEEDIPLLTAITPGIGLVAAPMGGYLSDRFGGMKVILILGFIAPILIFLMGQIPNIPLFVIMMVAVGLVSNVRMPTSESFIAGNTPEHRRSTMLGIYFFAGTGVAGPLSPLVGNMIDRMGYEMTFTYAAVATAVITVLAAIVMWRYIKKDSGFTGTSG